MKNATAVVAGNGYLATRAHAAGANRIVTIPTVIDLKRYPATSPNKDDNLVIGWIGSPSTKKYVVQFGDVFYRASKQHDFTLRACRCK